MHPKLKTGLYGLSILVIYAIIVFVLRRIVNHNPIDYEYFGVYSQKDVLLGLGLAIALTFAHERKKNLNK